MEKDFGDVELSVNLVEGKLVLGVELESKGVGAGLSVSVDSDYFIDKLAALIPGQIDDAVFAILKGALKNAKI